MTRRAWLVGVFAFLALVLLVLIWLPGARATRAESDQPVPYSHRVHIGAGIQCLFCHSDAARSPIAGIPSVQKCVGCHQVIDSDSESVQVLLGYWERGEPIPWQRVNKQPEFVYFSHRPHLGAGLNCEICHGNVAAMDTVVPVYEMDMGWCLQCHEEQPTEKLARLVDCVTCHQ